MKINKIISLFIIFIIPLITIGYATYSKLFEFSGNVLINPDGKIEVLNIEMIDSSNVLSSDIPIITSNNIEFNIIFEGENEDFFALYSLDILNNSSYDYIYNEFAFTPIVYSPSGATGELSLEVQGISNLDVIRSGERRNITLKLILNVSDPSQSYNAQGSTNLETTQQNKGNITTAVTILDDDLTGENNFGLIKLSIINTTEDDINIQLESSNSNFVLIQSDGQLLSNIFINASSEQEYDIYIKVNNNSLFTQITDTTNIILKTPNNGNIYTERILLNVSITEEIDNTIPEISEITFVMDDIVGQANVSFSRLDSGGSSIVNYVILLYDAATNNLLNTYNTNSAITSYTLNSLEDGSYYVKVYGIDAAGNSGENEINNASLTNIHCRLSDTVNMKWRFTVDTSGLSNINFTGNNTVNLGETYQATLSTTNYYTLPNTITVLMNNVTLSVGSDYTYDKSTGSLIIPNIRGDLKISGTGVFSGICLVEGTKIRLANDIYKDIEDITYNDLLKVWNYDTGSVTSEYPIWIEKEGSIFGYQLTEFSDGSILKTVGYHGVFNKDLNMFVSVNDEENFKVGSNIIKLDENGKLYDVKVVSINKIYEQVKFYHVVSTRYYNVIANDFLTTDGTVILSNLYGFDKNITWGEVRKNLIDNSYTYQDLSILPYYLYKGLRASEAKNLVNYGLTLEVFKNYLLLNQLNENILKEVDTNSLGKRIWMVTTSDDIVSEDNIEEFLYEENSLYELPFPKDVNNFLYWYNTSDNNNYMPGDKLNVYHGTHFEAIYK